MRVGRVGHKRALLIGLAGLCAGIVLTWFLPRRSHEQSLHFAAPPHLTWPALFAERVDVSTFFKGNIHTHSSLSDGDSPPEDVYRWYQSHGYAFVALTDHNRLVDPDLYRALERSGFRLITGEEITMWSRGVPVHVNALCTKKIIGGGAFPTPGSALRWAVAEVRAQGGAALVNHPNFEWALTERDLPDASGAQLLEIWSGHPYVRTEGDLLHKSHEAIWDEALTAGESFAGVAVDDMHNLDPTAPEASASRPGRGFIEVFASELSEGAICDALRHGRLYASTGARLRRLVVEGSSMTVWPEAEGANVDFVGAHGEVLARARVVSGSVAAPGEHPGQDGSVTYRLRGSELYVRARITQADGKRAWTPAYRAAR